MNTAYPLFPVTIIVLLAYFITRIFSHWDIISLKWHRKFWNYLLLITFLVSGLLGVLSVVKVNYKLEIPYYETIMQWHVVLGIAMVFIAFYHLSWHLKYYFTFRRKQKVEKTEPLVPTDAGQPHLKLFLFLLGMVAIINQVVFIREFTSVLSGNELVVGIIMSAWMLITGWGALQGRKGRFNNLSAKRGVIMLSALSLFPIVLVSLLYLLKNLLFPAGTIINIANCIIAALLLLFPVCFLSGYLFTAFSSLYSINDNTIRTGKSYAIESAGSLVGGLLFSIILGRLFSTSQIFGISAAIIILLYVWIIKRTRKQTNWKLIITGIFIPVLIFMINPDKYIKELSYPNQTVVISQNTRYGNLVVTSQAGQYNVYEDNHLLFYTDNVMVNEEAVHFAMVQHHDPKQVLLISGGIAGMINEIMKYNVDHITYIEPNPGIFRLKKKQNNLLPDTGIVSIIKKDIRNYITTSDNKFDVILINLPPPTSLGFNRFYTEEFFRQLKNHCNKETVICTSLPSTANYADESALESNSSLWKTLGQVFNNRLLLTGEKNYFLASNSRLSSAITEKIHNKNISTQYVNQYYVDDRLLTMRSETLTSQLIDSVPVNYDFYPYIFSKEISHWLSYFGTRYHLLIIIPAVFFLILFFKTNHITAGLYTGGFTSASLEVTLLLAYQVYFGSIYLNTAIFFSVFMAGLAFGSTLKFSNKVPPIRSYYFLQFMLVLFAVLLPFLITIMGKMTDWKFFVQIIFFILIFILATGIGFEFLLASKLQQKSFSEVSGINYSIDLAGSAFGAFITAIVLLPLLGLVNTCLIVAALNVISGLMAFTARKSYVT